jgi:hypothetical protein
MCPLPCHKFTEIFDQNFTASKTFFCLENQFFLNTTLIQPPMAGKNQIFEKKIRQGGSVTGLKRVKKAPFPVFCARTFQGLHSERLWTPTIYMIFYIIIGHRSNKIQSLLDIDELFSFFFKKTQIQFFI